MSRTHSIAFSFGLMVAGACTWAFAGHPLLENPDLKVPLNPLGINRSPYGEVFAMAMQDPIDSYFDAGMSIGVSKPEVPATPPLGKTPATWHARFEALVTSLGQISEVRTNPKAASAALKRHLRRQAEDKLRFAYQLDPSHYGNYNSLHFFLTEPEVGTRPELTPSSAKLAEDTIEYCLKQDQDPRPALTAAAAVTNILHLMFNDQHAEKPKYNVSQMRPYLNLLDHCIARYVMISKEWEQSKHWDLLSPQRIAECEERFNFIGKIRDAAEKTILRLEQGKTTPQVLN